jgi:hypothetical protein
MTKDWDTPTDLSPLGLAAVSVFKTFAKEKKTTYSGSKVFYSPKEWADRGESFGLNSELIIQYDGSPDVRFLAALSHDVAGALLMHGLYVESCTGWYSAVYKI